MSASVSRRKDIGVFKLKRGSAYSDRNSLSPTVRGALKGVRVRGRVPSRLAVRGIIQTTMGYRSWVSKTRILF